MAMSTETLRKIKAFMLILMLSVAEGRRIHALHQLQSLGAAASERKATSSPDETDSVQKALSAAMDHPLLSLAPEPVSSLLKLPIVEEQIVALDSKMRTDENFRMQVKLLQEAVEAWLQEVTAEDPSQDHIGVAEDRFFKIFMNEAFEEFMGPFEELLEDQEVAYHMETLIKKLAENSEGIAEVDQTDSTSFVEIAQSSEQAMAFPFRLPARLTASRSPPAAMSKTKDQSKPMALTDKNARRSVLGLGALAASAAITSSAQADSVATPWSTKSFYDAVAAGVVEKAEFSDDGKKVTCVDVDGNRHATLLLAGSSGDVIKMLQDKNIAYNVAPPEPDNSAIFGGLLNSAPLLLFFGLIAFNFFRRQNGGDGGGMGQMGPGGPNPFQMGKSQAKIQMEPNTGVNFNDVAGAEGAKQELTEVVDFLKDPSKYSALGAKIPKGCIMEGPPGTGKTLLARAVAGEAGVPFIAASGSEFVQMFVGVGASRVRDLFGQAKKNAPCIVFIDEIDAIGRQRAGGGGGMGGGNDEREQTLNQILTEMDGFEGNTGVIVIAATNRADILDAALIRPGRFDRRVPVDLPDVRGRVEILKVHIRGKPLKPEVDLGIIAKRTIGFSGAGLANLMNEAAIVAARTGKKEIGYEEVDYAIDRQTVGMEKTTGTSFPARQKLVAYHEAGHAIMGLLTPDYDLVTKVTIVPRTSGAGGFTLFTPPEERLESGMYTKKYLQAQLAVALGGRVAEEIIFGPEEITTGASNDLQQVRNIARRMVAQWGFANEAMGAAPVAWETPDGTTFTSPRTASETTEKEIDEQVKLLVKSAYETVTRTLTENREFLDEMAKRLVEEETLDYNQMEKMRDEFAKSSLPVPTR
jgi:cell division protease FtsH